MPWLIRAHSQCTNLVVGALPAKLGLEVKRIVAHRVAAELHDVVSALHKRSEICVRNARVQRLLHAAEAVRHHLRGKGGSTVNTVIQGSVVVCERVPCERS
jgi:hypothetical protein